MESFDFHLVSRAAMLFLSFYRLLLDLPPLKDALLWNWCPTSTTPQLGVDVDFTLV